MSNSVSTEDKVYTYFKRGVKGELEDVYPLMNRTPGTKSEIENAIFIFVTQLSNSSNNHDSFNFEIESIDDNLNFVIIETSNNVKIKHATA